MEDTGDHSQRNEEEIEEEDIGEEETEEKENRDEEEDIGEAMKIEDVDGKDSMIRRAWTKDALSPDKVSLKNRKSITRLPKEIWMEWKGFNEI
ncbi:hypothetical protein M8J77_016354 [Diaphorina citri]|nr:hypothetical protein M8J77_016354 [Diaphorina citri]